MFNSLLGFGSTSSRLPADVTNENDEWFLLKHFEGFFSRRHGDVVFITRLNERFSHCCPDAALQMWWCFPTVWRRSVLSPRSATSTTFPSSPLAPGLAWRGALAQWRWERVWLCVFTAGICSSNIVVLPAGWCVLQSAEHGPDSGSSPGGLWRDSGARCHSEGPECLPARHWPVVSCWSVPLLIWESNMGLISLQTNASVLQSRAATIPQITRIT